MSHCGHFWGKNLRGTTRTLPQDGGTIQELDLFPSQEPESKFSSRVHFPFLGGGTFQWTHDFWWKLVSRPVISCKCPVRTSGLCQTPQKKCEMVGTGFSSIQSGFYRFTIVAVYLKWRPALRTSRLLARFKDCAETALSMCTAPRYESSVRNSNRQWMWQNLTFSSVLSADRNVKMPATKVRVRKM